MWETPTFRLLLYVIVQAQQCLSAALTFIVKEHREHCANRLHWRKSVLQVWVNDGRRFLFVCTIPLTCTSVFLPLIISFSLNLDFICHESLSKEFCTLFTQVWIQSASFLLKSDSLSSNLLVTYSDAARRRQFREISLVHVAVRQASAVFWLVWTDERLT